MARYWLLHNCWPLVQATGCIFWLQAPLPEKLLEHCRCLFLHDTSLHLQGRVLGSVSPASQRTTAEPTLISVWNGWGRVGSATALCVEPALPCCSMFTQLPSAPAWGAHTLTGCIALGRALCCSRTCQERYQLRPAIQCTAAHLCHPERQKALKQDTPDLP